MEGGIFIVGRGGRGRGEYSEVHGMSVRRHTGKLLQQGCVHFSIGFGCFSCRLIDLFSNLRLPN